MRLSQILTIAINVALVLAMISADASAQSESTATGSSNKLNPAISLNSLFRAQKSDAVRESDGLSAQEFELAIVSVVDSHFRASVHLAFEPESDSAETEAVAIEEAYVTAFGLPTGWGLKAGRFFAPLGRHNQLHTHQFPFIDAPRAIAMTLGEENLGDVGLLASYLPALPWYLDLQAYVTDSATDAFDHASNRVAIGARVESLFELSESATVEFGSSVLSGPREGGATNSFAGADLRLKWKDARSSQGRAIRWLSEFVYADLGEGDIPGAYTSLLVRNTRRWWSGVAYSWNSADMMSGESTGEHEAKLQLAWIPSEFSALRAELGWLDTASASRTLTASLQLNFTIGAHPAHKY